VVMAMTAMICTNRPISTCSVVVPESALSASRVICQKARSVRLVTMMVIIMIIMIMMVMMIMIMIIMSMLTGSTCGVVVPDFALSASRVICREEDEKDEVEGDDDDGDDEEEDDDDDDGEDKTSYSSELRITPASRDQRHSSSARPPVP
jgi:hypothetical protein